jgi:hypothetical protein
MKRIAVMSLALVLGVATALTVGHFAVAAPQTLHAKAQWAEVYRTPGGLVSGADLIVVARHVAAQPGRVVGDTPFTYNGFEIQSVLKGAHDGRELVVEQTGGLMDNDVILGIDDGGRFVPGRSYLLFLKAQGDHGVYYQINHQARYEINGDGTLRGVDPTDAVVAAFNGRTLDEALDKVARRVRMMQ